MARILPDPGLHVNRVNECTKNDRPPTAGLEIAERHSRKPLSCQQRLVEQVANWGTAKEQDAKRLGTYESAPRR